MHVVLCVQRALTDRRHALMAAVLTPINPRSYDVQALLRALLIVTPFNPLCHRCVG